MIFSIPTDITSVNYVDLPKLHRLSVETFNDTFRKSTTNNDFIKYTNKNYNYGQLAQELMNPESFFYFIYYNHKLAGYLKLNVGSAQTKNMGNNSLEIDRIYLRHGFKYIGLEDKLIEFTMNQAKLLHKNSIWSSVWEYNLSIVNFYKQFGFKSIGSQKFTLDGTTKKDLIMKTELVNLG
ncbi:hypothetical protein NBRC111452_1752 [Companilactobacillus farciminis]|jgi:ribosomal protein S18 acetylase RimI-like enzyme|nr:hypothetical protein NBRC111452_1752 [Companilactobacillus farciminis]